jgi:hypothetical protein
MKNAGVTSSKDRKQVETMNPARRWSPARSTANETSTDLLSGKGSVLGEGGPVFIRLDDGEPCGLKNSKISDRLSTHGCYTVLHLRGLQSLFSRPVREPRRTREALPFFSRDHHRAHIPSVPILRARANADTLFELLYPTLFARISVGGARRMWLVEHNRDGGRSRAACG